MKTKVLITDDQADIRKLVRMTLDIGDFEVYEADSGMSALEMVQSVKPNIVLMDIMMPGDVDGLQACRWIKDHPSLSNTAVILLSGRDQPTDIATGKTAGADVYLVKPFGSSQLLDTVTQIAERQSFFSDL
ncbi:MAG: response regulator [Rhodocyclaceae bacterium]|nr:MAG: response regulator [Rhodocyclaceae bacterium]